MASVLQKGFPIITNASANQYATVGKWLLGTGGMVVGMIHVGGLTRLTSSGLSMTDWSVTGSLPPMNEEAWLAEFDRYKQYPEWQQRQSMTLDEFQYIYAWEYGHRMLGRVVGLVFVVPWMYFSVKGKIPKGYQMRMMGLGLMGGTQGLVGWWMVKSGLTDDRRGDPNQIRVKPIRLASHLSMAFATYAALLWTGWDVLGMTHSNEMIKYVNATSREALRHASRVRMAAAAVTSLTAVTIVSGALVAGNDAGRTYNTWPKMGDDWIPAEVFNGVKPFSKRAVEDSATVQFNHRLLGQVTGVAALAMVGFARPHLMTPQARRGLTAVGLATTAQVVLGITTLLNYVPISLAAVHQLGSVVVFTSGLYLVHSLRYARPALLHQAARTFAKEGPMVASVAKKVP
ncbi:Cytochrome oxidase assembly protein [Fragilaria crotonensis]|nr:Cytochrome oxidase assembly protein [Fragilaria crotonensis]